MIKKTENKVLTHPCLTPLEMENFSTQMNCIEPRKTCERKTNKQTKKLKVGSESNFSVTSTWPVRCFWLYWMLHSTLQIPSNLRFVSVAAFIRRIERFSTNRTEIHFGRFHVSSDLCQSISISVCWCRIAFACWTICKGDIYCLFNQVLVNCTFRMHLEREKKKCAGKQQQTSRGAYPWVCRNRFTSENPHISMTVPAGDRAFYKISHLLGHLLAFPNGETYLRVVYYVTARCLRQ